MKFIKKCIKYILKKCKSIITKQKITQGCFNVCDIFFNQFNTFGKFNRFDIIVRYIAIENYYGINKTGFELYEKMQNKRIGDGEARTSQFKELINSYENGYNDTSKISLNTTLKLLDGSHRLALHIYNGINNINGICKHFDTHEPEYSLDWFYANGFTLSEIKSIQDKYYEICKKLNIGLTCTIWPPVADFYTDITNEMSYYGEITDINIMFFSNDYEFESVVKGIYHSDDIAGWKIQKKLDYMKDYNKTILIMKLRTDNPFFRIKSSTGLPLSRYVERVKYVFRERYKNSIPNYFHDVIIHIADNYAQSAYIDKLLKINIDVSEFFKSIADMEYVLSKIETPYMPNEFPCKAPLNKDIDILCSKDSFEKIAEVALNFVNSFDSETKVIKKVFSDQILIRIELVSFLIYQFDISKALLGFNDIFIEFCIKTRKQYKKCFITNENCEYLIRLFEYRQHPKKTHHFLYLQKYKNKFDMNLFSMYMLNPNSYKVLLETLDIKYNKYA